MISEIGNTPSSAAAAPVNRGGQLGKDEFLKMLIAQIRHQDPLNPMKGDDMAAQLAHFSSIEQLSNIGKLIEGQSTFQEGMIASIHDTAAMNILGKTVLAAGDQINLGGDGVEEITVDVGSPGGLGTLLILDGSGRQVGSRDLGFVASGRHEFPLGGAAEGLPPGQYRYAVEVEALTGGNVPVQPMMTAKVDGVQYGPSGPILTSGPLRIPFPTIVQVRTD